MPDLWQFGNTLGRKERVKRTTWLKVKASEQFFKHEPKVADHSSCDLDKPESLCAECREMLAEAKEGKNG